MSRVGDHARELHADALTWAPAGGGSRLPFGLAQDDIDRAARKLADLGYDVGDRPPVDGIDVSPNLRMAMYSALKAAEGGRRGA